MIAGPDRPDTKILRFRANAVSLSRSAEQCRTTLKTIQAERPQPVAQAVPARLLTPLPPMTAAKIAKAKSEARDMLAGLARLGAAPGQGMTAIRIITTIIVRRTTANLLDGVASDGARFA